LYCENDWGHSVQQTSDGGYIITGYTSSFGAGENDVYLIKTDSLGDTLWTKTYGGFDSDIGWSVQQTKEGGYIITGRTKSFGGEYEAYLIKTDSSGDSLWTRTFGGSNDDYGYIVQQTVPDGGYIITGYTYSFGAGRADVYLIKTDSLGDTLWTKTYGSTDIDYGYSVQQTSDGGFIIAGYTYSGSGSGSIDAYLIKTDPLGDTLWTKTIGGNYAEFGTSIQQTVSDKGYIIVGYSESSSGGWPGDIYLIKTDSLGDSLWTKTYGGSGIESCFSVQQTSDGGYVITGLTESFGAGAVDAYLIKTDSTGDTLWTRTFGGTVSEQGRSVQQTSDGGFIITGVTNSFGAGGLDVYLIKTDGSGMVGIEESNDEYRTRNIEFRLLQNKPNPFSTLTALSYELGAPARTTLKIYDITGKLVKILVDKRQDPGVYQIHWEGKDIGSGIYFYRLQSGDYSTTKKLILLK
jgi:hypothetical protein